MYQCAKHVAKKRQTNIRPHNVHTQRHIRKGIKRTFHSGLHTFRRAAWVGDQERDATADKIQEKQFYTSSFPLQDNLQFSFARTDTKFNLTDIIMQTHINTPAPHIHKHTHIHTHTYTHTHKYTRTHIITQRHTDTHRPTHQYIHKEKIKT